MAKGIHDQRYRDLMSALKSARKAKGLNQTEVARALGSRQQFVSKYETGERRLDAVEFLDVAAILGLDGIAILKSILDTRS